MTTMRIETVQAPRIDAVPQRSHGASHLEGPCPYRQGLYGAAFLRSPYAHARLVSVDAQRAERLQSVHAVVAFASRAPGAPQSFPGPGLLRGRMVKGQHLCACGEGARYEGARCGRGRREPQPPGRPWVH